MTNFNFDTFPILKTERLTLRQITMNDTQDWLSAWNHPEVLRYLIDFETEPDEAEVKSIIEWADAIYANKTGIRWAITDTDDDVMVGSCGFHLYNPQNRWAEIGYELHFDHWRKGIMSETVNAVLDFCFETLNCHRVEANVTVGNEGSAGLLRSLGFTLEGTWRDKVYWQGEFHSLWQFGLLEGEYK